MNLDEVRRLIAGGETLTLEMKRELSADALVETVVCLANAEGGQILVGVDEPTGEIVGAPPWPRMELVPERIEAHVTANTEPAVVPSVTVLADGPNPVVVVEVPPTETVVATGKGRFLRRALDVRGSPQCLPMRPSDVQSRLGSTRQVDFARTPLPAASLDDLDPAEIQRYRDSVTTQGGDAVLAELADSDLLRALDLMGPPPANALCVGSVLLFGTQSALRRHLPGAEIAFQQTNGSREATVNEVAHLPLLRAMAELVAHVQARNSQEELDVGIFRVPIPRFAEVTVRELVANALTHRDYTALGPTNVVLSDGALEVSNPGGFPAGITLDNILVAHARPRNPLLADAFKRAGLVERTGRGVGLAFFGQLRSGHPPPDYSRSNAETVTVRVRAGPADREFAGYVEEARREGHVLELEELQVLHEVRRESVVTTARVAEVTQQDRGTAAALLGSLVEKGLLEPRGQGRGREYHLSEPMYRRFNEESRYARVRGLDRLQQQQLIRAYVRTHGSISRREAAQLCGTTPPHATRLLREMRDAGELSIVGERRTARYVIAR